MPIAGPFTIAIVGFIKWRNQMAIIAVDSSINSPSRVKGDWALVAFCSSDDQSLMSAPAEKARPAPVTTTTRMRLSNFNSCVTARIY